MKIEYLIFNCIVLGGPLFLSLFPFIFVKKPLIRSAFTAITIPAIVFLIWDYLVIDYFWYFNESYILGPRILNIPIEEALFFITVPYACLFVWENWKRTHLQDIQINIRIVILLISLLFLFIYSTLLYTFVVICGFIIIQLLDVVLRTQLFTSKRFLSFLGIIILLTVITNGYLTARPIVLYNQMVKTNINIWTVPVEDIVYGLTLISFVVILYEKNYPKRSSPHEMNK